MISRFVEDPPYIQNAKPGKIDGIGLGLLALWLGSLQIVLDKGQEDDWFGAVWIRWTTMILVTGFVAFLWRELTHDKPLVDLRIFRNRNFLSGCILIFLFGAVVYGLVTLLPLFFQELLGYTALAAGMAVAPRGLGSLFFMPAIGVLTGKVDNRYLVCFGFVGTGLCTLWMGRSTLEIAQWSLFWPIVFSGACMSLIFVPLATSTMGTLRNEEIGNASGLYNLMRNVGGSIGISVVNTLLARHEQTHRDELSHNMAQYSHVFQDQLRALTRVPVATRRPGHRGASGARHPEPHAHRTGVAVVVCGRLPLSRGAVLSVRSDRVCHGEGAQAGAARPWRIKFAPFCIRA